MMSPLVRTILAVVGGLIVGTIVNGGIVNLGGSIIPPPEGADVSTMEGLKASMHLFEPKHFLMPFLAHALGTFVGAFLGVKIALKNHLNIALAIGGMFLLGGLIMIFSVPSPTWFNILDAGLAYVPMAFLAYRLGAKKS